MKVKSFQSYLKLRLKKQEMEELESQVDAEYQMLQSLQDNVSQVIAEYMAKEKIGFNELMRRLGVGPSTVAKLQKGESNLTLATVAHLSATMKKKVRLVFE